MSDAGIITSMARGLIFTVILILLIFAFVTFSPFGKLNKFLNRNNADLEIVKTEKDVMKPEDELLQGEALGIRLKTPIAGEVVFSPLAIEGDAKGKWYFEAQFSATLYDSNDNVIAQGPATALADSYTENFVPFKAQLSFAKPSTDSGYIVLRNANPSGLPENSISFSIPVKFK